MPVNALAPPLRLGLIINPIAGIGGPAALKGSDGEEVQQMALSSGQSGRGCRRAARTVDALQDISEHIHWLTWAGAMGADVLRDWPGSYQIFGETPDHTTAEDTRQAARSLAAEHLDLLLFAGGDGTARDVYDALGQSVPVLGIPAGVKMQSGVFASTPERAAQIVRLLVNGVMVSAELAEVRDLDESKLPEGIIKSILYGEMQVPGLSQFMTQTKVGGRESEALVLEELAAFVQDHLQGMALLGPGSTVAAVKQSLGFEGTLLGFDLWESGRLLLKDLNREAIEQLDAKQLTLIISFSRGQGVLFGRGNQQLSAKFLRQLTVDNLWVLGTRTKVLSLAGRPLQIDTDDPELDRLFPGLISIITGYQDRIWYRTTTDV